MRCVLIRVAAALLMLAMDAGSSALAGIESLIKPGQLIAGHAEYEEACGKCHEPFSKHSQSTLCRNCHEEVDADMRHETGFHGRGVPGQAACNDCHTDHQGRDADIVRMDEATFAHGQTDYPLQGAHRAVECTACHADGDKYRDAPQECTACHEDTGVHDGRLGEACGDCHDTQGWRMQEFDHDSTEFALHGKHARLACNLCHADSRYRDIPADCHACHRLNDVHAGRYGRQCGDCHAEDGWDKPHFDHERDTDWPLSGRHREVQCDVCHPGRLHEPGRDTRCVACHRGDDRHSGRFGQDCHSCHTPGGWGKQLYDHDAKTDFPLRGKHRDVLCASCHRGDVQGEKLARGCSGCHQADDVHGGQEGEHCESCHDEDGWAGRIRFEHDMTAFPLLGMHAVAACEECHLSTAYKMTSFDCSGCHRSDDVHGQRLGARCELCHNPNEWSLWQFDHALQTKYELDGAHEGIDCLSCHARPVTGEIDLSTRCVACHRADDVHDGQFGTYCDRCHVTESFAVVEIR